MFFVVLKLFRFAFTFLFFNMLPFCNRPLSQQVWIEVIPKVKRKQRSQWQVQHEPSKSGPVFILKVVDTLVFDTKIFSKSSFIFVKNCKVHFYNKFFFVKKWQKSMSPKNFPLHQNLNFIRQSQLMGKIKELLLNNIVSKIRECTTFTSMNTGPDFDP